LGRNQGRKLFNQIKRFGSFKRSRPFLIGNHQWTYSHNTNSATQTYWNCAEQHFHTNWANSGQKMFDPFFDLVAFSFDLFLLFD